MYIHTFKMYICMYISVYVYMYMQISVNMNVYAYVYYIYNILQTYIYTDIQIQTDIYPESHSPVNLGSQALPSGGQSLGTPALTADTPNPLGYKKL